MTPSTPRARQGCTVLSTDREYTKTTAVTERVSRDGVAIGLSIVEAPMPHHNSRQNRNSLNINDAGSALAPLSRSSGSSLTSSLD